MFFRQILFRTKSKTVGNSWRKNKQIKKFFENIQSKFIILIMTDFTSVLIMGGISLGIK